MIVRFTFQVRDLDRFGVLEPEALRQMARCLWDVPAGIQVRIDLGPCRQVQRQLIRDLSLYRCALLVTFESKDWRTVRDHTRAMSTAVGVPA